MAGRAVGEAEAGKVALGLPGRMAGSAAGQGAWLVGKRRGSTWCRCPVRLAEGSRCCCLDLMRSLLPASYSTDTQTASWGTATAWRASPSATPLPAAPGRAWDPGCWRR